MDDLISRQAALDAIRELESGEDYNFNNGLICAMNNVAELPSAQPEPTFKQIEEYCRKRCLAIVDHALLAKYASAQPERKGRWIVMETAYEDTAAKCSECGFETLVNEPGNGLHMVGEMHYCPHCGAHMKRGEDNGL